MTKKQKQVKIIIVPPLSDLPITGKDYKVIKVNLEVESSSSVEYSLGSTQIQRIDFVRFLKVVCKQLGWKIEIK